ncbi:MAG: hypothetical protein ABIY55_20990 [Kofleriaceae bacterium]
MSTLFVLYVYAPTTFTSDTKIETVDGDALVPDQAHQITLPAGIYRFPDTATVTPAGKGDGFDRRLHTKGDLPDPPLHAKQQLAAGVAKLDGFLNSAGDEPEEIL